MARRKRSGWEMGVVAAVMAAGTGACADRAPQAGSELGPGEVSVTDSAGVMIVTHGSLAELEALPRLELTGEPILTIGFADAGPGQEPYLFRMAHRARLLSDGTIAVSEPLDGEIRIFDGEEGAFLRSVGRPGEGPGEFELLAWFDVLPGDSLAVWDDALARTTVFAPDGTVARVERRELPAEARPLIPAGSFPDGSLLLLLFSSELPLQDAVSERSETMARWNPADPARLDTLAAFPIPGTFVDRDFRIHPGLGMPFAPRPAWAARGRRLHVGFGSTFSFSTYDAVAGRLERVVRSSEPPVPIPPAEVDAVWDERLEAAADAARRALVRRVRGLVAAPEYFPALAGMVVSREGNVWVRRYPLPEDEVQIWHVFDPEGFHLGWIDIPEDLQVLEVAGHRIVARHTDELGVRTLRVHGLDPRVAGGLEGAAP